MLEAAQYADNAFVTLTYDEEGLAKLPHVHGAASLEPKHLQDFLKRLRARLVELSGKISHGEQVRRIRYFGVGEYGDESQRPHFHLALFNYPTCAYGGSRYGRSRNSCCAACDQIREAWGHGLIYVGTLEAHSAQYIAGYVTKKMTNPMDERLEGRHPEFSRMSLRPGIGRDAMHEVASVLMQFNLDTSQGDVPSALRHGGRLLPLGRYLRRSLREMVGKSVDAPASSVEQAQEAVRAVREVAFNNSRSFKEVLEEVNKAQLPKLESRQRVFKKRGSI